MKRDFISGKLLSEGKLKEYKCENCGKVIFRYDSDKPKKKYCSKKCYGLGLVGKRKKSHHIINCGEYSKLIINSKKYGTFETLIDNDDIEKCIQHTWRVVYGAHPRSFYVHGPSSKSMHRMLTNCPKGMVVDHINHDTLDNRKSNLRVCTNAENIQNQKVKRNGNKSSGFRNICWNDFSKKWDVRIAVKNKTKYIGSYLDIEKAKIVAAKARKKYFNV